MTAAELTIWATLAATGVTAIATGVLAWVTWLLFQATKRMAAATTDPNIVVTIEPGRWSFIHLELVVENSGTGPAYDVQLSLDPPLMRDRNGSSEPLPLNAISVLRPSCSIRNLIGSGANLLDSSFAVTISWKASPTSKSRTEVKYDLSLSHYRGLIQLGGGDPAVNMAQEIKKIRESLDRMIRGPGRIAVDTFNQSDRNKEYADMEKRFREQ